MRKKTSPIQYELIAYTVHYANPYRHGAIVFLDKTCSLSCTLASSPVSCTERTRCHWHCRGLIYPALWTMD